MRILLVNYEYPPVGGGAATATEALARALVRLGHEVLVLTGSYKGLPARSDDQGVVVRRVWSLRRRLDSSGIVEMCSFVIAAKIALPFIIRAERVGGIVAFFSIPGGPIALTGRVLCGVPYVISLRGGDVPGTEPSLRGLHRLLTPLRRMILRRSLAIVAPSEGLKRMSQQVDPFAVRVIPNGVDSTLFAPSPSPLPGASEPFRFLFVGRLQAQKNLAWLFERLGKLTLGRWTLDLIGDGPERAKLEALAHKLDLTSAIKWRGWVGREELPPIYRACHCFVNSSLYEGMPNVVLEAMASGLPVIASRVPGNEELVVDGENGYLCDLQSPGQFIEAMQRLIDDPALGFRLGAAGRARVVQEFSWEKIARDYAALFDGVSP